jgi:hypothetical protein
MRRSSTHQTIDDTTRTCRITNIQWAYLKLLVRLTMEPIGLSLLAFLVIVLGLSLVSALARYCQKRSATTHRPRPTPAGRLPPVP